MHIAITGASSGIGAALAQEYAQEGAMLSLLGRDQGRLEQIAALVRARGALAFPATGDVRDAAAMRAWASACFARAPVDVLIANAGISAGTGGGDETLEQAQAIFDVNVTGVLNALYPVFEAMRARGQGQIALMSSLAGFRGFPGAPAYCASKAAVRLYGQALRTQAQAYGIKVNVICPGFVKTPMTDVNRFYMPFLMPPEKAARLIRQGLSRNRPLIAFPWPLYALVRLVAALPSWSVDALAGQLPKKELARKLH